MKFAELKIGEKFIFERNMDLGDDGFLKLKTGHQVFKYINNPKSRNTKCIASALVLTRGHWNGK